MISELGSQSIKGLSGSHHPWGSRDHTDSSNPTPPPAWTVCRREHSKPQCFDDSRDAKHDSIWAARREMQAPHDRHAPSQHGRYRRPKQLARNAKNPGKTRVFERRGPESNFWVFSLCFVLVRKVPDGCFRTRLYRSHPTELVDSGLAFTASPPIPSTRWFDDGTSGSRFGIRTTLRPESIWRRRSSSPIR